MEKADKGGYAIPAFNYSDIWDFLAIIEAAEEEKSAVITSPNPQNVKAIEVDYWAAIGKVGMQLAKVPVIHHLDHSTSFELCSECIKKGYPSVMIDGSALKLEENIALTRKVVEFAHPQGVCVEGELGRIKGKGIESEYEGEDFLVNVEEAIQFVKETKVDSLAIGIGTVHGFYKDSPELNFERLAEVNEAVQIPLVLHGGTGIPDEDIKKAISLGMNKVNIGTIIHSTYMKSLKEELNNRDNDPYILEVILPVKEKIKKVVKDRIRVCASSYLSCAGASFNEQNREKLTKFKSVDNLL